MKRLLARLKKDERGLTLVELLAVVVILAIIMGIAFVLIGNVIENSKKDAHVSNAMQLIAAAKLYETTTGKDIEVDGAVTNEKDTGVLYTDGLIKDIIDPWTKGPMTNYGTVTKTNGVYTVVFDADNGGCNIDATEEDLLKDGRENCGSTTP